MKNLLLLRHAKAIKGEPNLRDFDRPLSDIGLAQIPVVSQKLKETKILPDLIISSSAKRTSQTAQLMADHLKYRGEFKWLDELYEARREDYINILKKIPNNYSNIMLVGHNPTHEEFLCVVTNRAETLSTGALAVVELPIKNWNELTELTLGKIIDIWKPKEIMN